MRKKVLITGSGLISALGSSVEECLGNLQVGQVQGASCDHVKSQLDNPPCTFSVPDAFRGSDGDCRHTRTAKLALEAVRQALSAARGGTTWAAKRVGVCLGTTVGNTFNEESFYRAYTKREDPDASAITRFLHNDLATVVAGELGAYGPVQTIASACASGTDAIGLGAMWIRAGYCDVAVVGGADELARFPYLGFSVLGNSSSSPCRPFDRDRAGLNLGEGAGILILEGDDDGSPPPGTLGSVLGYGTAADAHHATAPHPDGRGLRASIQGALSAAVLSVGDIDFVNAHGTGTKENDRVEGKVLLDLFGRDVPVFSTKGATGHTLGAAGAVEAVLTLHHLRNGMIPASIGFETPDPECRLIPNLRSRSIAAEHALSVSLAFGGVNSALVLGTEGSE